MSDRQSSKPNSSADQRQPSRVLSVKWAYRWDVFRRLKALEIDCQCSTNEPLLVDLYSPTTLVQIWSVVRQSSADRQELIDWLDNCWCVKYDQSRITSSCHPDD